jgi:hypothetical protein
VVAVGDQQLRTDEKIGDFFQHAGFVDAPKPRDRARRVRRFSPGLVELELDLLFHQRPRIPRAQREDRREVAAGCPHQLQAVPLGAGQGALVGQNLACVEVLDPDAGEDPVADVAGAVRAGVLLLHRPDRRLGVLDQRARLLPGVDFPRRQLVGVALGGLRPGLPVGLRQVDRDCVVGRACDQLGPHRGVDHVVGRRDDVLQRPDRVEVVVQGVEGLNVGHRRET